MIFFDFLKEVRMEERGFTLIELMVVVAVIGVLAAMLVPTVSGLTSKARDARRKSDIESIATALEMFRDKYARYPTPGEAGTNACGGWRGSNTNDFMQILITEGFLKKYPADPINTGNGCSEYCYSYYRYDAGYCGVPVAFYVLGARTLETGADPRRANVAGATCGRNWADEFNYLTWGRED